MADRHGIASWAGHTRFESCSYTNSRGSSPGIATLVIPEEDLAVVKSEGTLVLSDGVSDPLVLPDCGIVDYQPTTLAGGGRGVALQIADRRRRWKYSGTLAGWYNQLDPEPALGLMLDKQPALKLGAPLFVNAGPFVPGTERRPIDLLQYCLAAMQEPNIAIEGCPPGPRPQVDWKGESAVNALERIAAECEMQICYQPATKAGRVLVTSLATQIAKLGDLPAFDSRPVFAPNVAPPAFGVVGGPVWWADYLFLEPVGLDGDGQFRHIDNLSYKPAQGWAPYIPGVNHWQDVVVGKCKDIWQARALAKEWVWRAYRVTFDKQEWVKSIRPDLEKAFGPVRSVRQIVLSDRVYTATVDAAGSRITQDATVNGVIYKAGGWKALNHEPSDGPFPVGFSVDPLRQMVIFERPVYRAQPWNATGELDHVSAHMQGPPAPIASENPLGFFARPPLDLTIYTSFQVRSAATGQLVLGAWGQTGPGAEVTQRPELVPVFEQSRWISKGYTPLQLQSNAAEMTAAAAYYAALAKSRHQPKEGRTEVFAGIFPVDPDAAVAQVTYSVGGGGPCSTTVSVQTEHATWMPSYPERRLARLQGDLLRRSDAMARLLQKQDAEWHKEQDRRKGRL